LVLRGLYAGDYMKVRLMHATILLSILLLVVPCAAQAKLVSVSAATHVLALNDNGTVWAWGDNRYGQLGIGTMGGTQDTPQKVLIDNVTAISAAMGQSLALKSDGTVWAWGYGDDGRLGYGGYESQPVPVQVKNLTNIIAIAARGQNGYALKSDGTVWAWGDNRDGTIGDGTYGVTNFKSTPVQVKGLTDIKALGECERGTYAIKDDGTVYAWGQNTYGGDDTVYGALGDRSGPGVKPTPFLVEGVNNVAQIAGGTDNTVYFKDDGTVWAWGNNNFGAIGDSTISSSWPPDVRMPSVQLKIIDVMDVSTMNSHSVALKSDGTVWFWGRYIDLKGHNDNSGLPPTENTGESAPIKVNSLDHVVDVCAGYASCIVVKDDGSVWGWGRNDEKELGNTKNDVEPYPVLIFQGPAEATPIPTVTPVINSTSNSILSNTSQATSVSATSQADTPVSTPGFGFNTIALLGCLLINAGFLSGLIRGKKGEP